MRVSYSRVETFKQCPYKYKLSYIDGLKTYFNYDPANPLIVGTALHTGIEKDATTAISEYFANYPVINDLNIDESIKLENIIEKARAVLPFGDHEVKVEANDYIGFLDLLVEVGKGTYDLYDFKYSNNIDRYLESGQLHIYKWYFEHANPGKHIRKMYYLFCPKTMIRQKKTETLEQFRARLKNELESKNVQLVEVKYNFNKVQEFQSDSVACQIAQYFDKNPSRLCDWCDFQKYCESNGTDDFEIDWEKSKGVDNMQLPENKRRTIGTIEKKKIWIYGAPFSGKTYLANAFPDPLMLNTDGNTKFVDAPCIAIKDEVTTEGRITKRKYAWEIFKETIDELEKKNNTFKTIVVDLVEDTYESCRQFMFNKLGIEHESDSGFGKGWDMIKTEFLNTIKKLTTLDYENIILISHEDTSKDLTKKSGDKITSVKPNIGEKPANKIAGMMDMVVRTIEDEGKYTLSFKTNEYIFGGGRLPLNGVRDIPNDYTELCKVYAAGNEALVSGKAVSVPRVAAKGRAARAPEPETAPAPEPAPAPALETAVSEPVAETPEKPVETPKRRRRVSKEV